MGSFFAVKSGCMLTSERRKDGFGGGTAVIIRLIEGVLSAVSKHLTDYYVACIHCLLLLYYILHKPFCRPYLLGERISWDC